MKKRLHKHLEHIQEELIALMRDKHPQTAEDHIFHDLLFSIELIRESKFDIMELRLLNAALKELRHALKVFKEYYSIPKAAVFGSARAERGSPDYKIAKQFGKAMAKKDWMIITGGASGIMEAAMTGAGVKKSFGLNIVLPFEQIASPVIRRSKKLMYFKYFFTRKLIFLKESAATVLFPGGFGTFDEGFESFTLIQTGKARPRPVVLVDPPGSDYWAKILASLEETMVRRGYISAGDLELARHFQDPEAAVEEIVLFYRNYHSSRFLKDQYLIRLKKPLTAAQLKQINKEYQDIVTRGKFHLLKNIKEDDEKDPSLERVLFRFDRSSFHRLRSLIDLVNTF